MTDDRVQKYRILSYSFAIPEKTCSFAFEFRRHSGGVRKDFIEKVLLKLSSTFKLRNFDNGTKMIAIAPHLWYVRPQLATYITFGVGYCFIRSKGSAKT
ncbi:MAG: hypothetical protein J6R11_05795 [Bacteroidaceae bacterium]|nr:hypothetical protein [Bacteroidaceae bacterium]